MDNLMKNDFLKTIQMNVPMNMNRNVGPTEMEQMRSAVTLLVHFKYILLYVKEHFFIDIDYKINSFAPQLKSDLDQCQHLYNQLVESAKFLDFVRGKENNYHAKSPIYNAFKNHGFINHQHDPNQDINSELQNLYSNMVYGDGTAGNSAPTFDGNQIEHFRPLNEYEYFQSNAIATGHVDKYQHTQCEPYVNQIVANQMRRNYTNNNQEGTSGQETSNRKQPKQKRANTGTTRAKKPKKDRKKRKRVPEEWSRNKAKAMRNAGVEYVTCFTKKVVPAKRVQPPCESCIHKCTTKINEDQRKEVFEAYWALPNINMKRMYIASCLTQIQPKYRYPKGKTICRKLNNAFHFKLNGSMIRICKKFFLNTLDVTDRTIKTVVQKSKSTGIVEEDRRGKRPRVPKAVAEAAKTVESSQAQQQQQSQSQLPQTSQLPQSTQLSQTASSDNNCENPVNNNPTINQA